VWIEGESRHEYDHPHGYDAEHHYDVEAVCTKCHFRRGVERGEYSDQQVKRVRYFLQRR
jgi:hypothetical protein